MLQSVGHVGRHPYAPPGSGGLRDADAVGRVVEAEVGGGVAPVVGRTAAVVEAVGPGVVAGVVVAQDVTGGDRRS